MGRGGVEESWMEVCGRRREAGWTQAIWNGWNSRMRAVRIIVTRAAAKRRTGAVILDVAVEAESSKTATKGRAARVLAKTCPGFRRRKGPAASGAGVGFCQSSRTFPVVGGRGGFVPAITGLPVSSRRSKGGLASEIRSIIPFLIGRRAIGNLRKSGLLQRVWSPQGWIDA